MSENETNDAVNSNPEEPMHEPTQMPFTIHRDEPMHTPTEAQRQPMTDTEELMPDTLRTPTTEEAMADTLRMPTFDTDTPEPQ